MATLTEMILYISFSYSFISNKANSKILFVISGNKSFISQSLKVVSPLGEKYDFFQSLRI